MELLLVISPKLRPWQMSSSLSWQTSCIQIHHHKVQESALAYTMLEVGLKRPMLYLDSSVTEVWSELLVKEMFQNACTAHKLSKENLIVRERFTSSCPCLSLCPGAEFPQQQWKCWQPRWDTALWGQFGGGYGCFRVLVITESSVVWIIVTWHRCMPRVINQRWRPRISRKALIRSMTANGPATWWNLFGLWPTAPCKPAIPLRSFLFREAKPFFKEDSWSIYDS